MAQCYNDVRTAGFVVDSHSCWRSISNSTMRFGPSFMSSARLLQEWPAIMHSPAYTATAAIQAVLRPGYNTLVVRVTRWPLTPPFRSHFGSSPFRFRSLWLKPLSVQGSGSGIPQTWLVHERRQVGNGL